MACTGKVWLAERIRQNENIKSSSNDACTSGKRQNTERNQSMTNTKKREMNRTLMKYKEQGMCALWYQRKLNYKGSKHY